MENNVRTMCRDDCDILLTNPDRGLRMETYITLGKNLRAYPVKNRDPFERANALLIKYKEDSPTLCQLYVYLSDYVKKPLDELAFEQLKKMLEFFRNNGIRLLLRFAYSIEGVPDARYKYVKCHLEQINDFFHDNSELINDTLYCLQTGIIGYWGEGHSNKRLKNRYKKKVINSVCALAPKGIYTQVRTYDMLKLVSKENIAKVGIHDDYIIGDMAHKWSFVPSTREKEFCKTTRHTRLTVNDGEMPWGWATLDDKPNAPSLSSLDGISVLRQLQAYSMTSFSLEHNYKEDGCCHSLEKWKTQFFSYKEISRLGITVNPCLFKDRDGNDIELSIYDIIRYHLGYQLMISDFCENDGEVTFSLTNYGFAPALNFNYLAVVIKNTATDEIIEKEIIDYDKTLLQSGASISYKAVIPDGYSALGIIADTFKSRGINPRFANSTPFIDGVQYFK
ncbi:DUF4874 domain-containing protein [Eubacterium sp.]|uniref:DUF4874 domain-containing protein n=1 Tax=Eubacterium sp. TaxID=142586 RepID=UPI003F121EC8